MKKISIIILLALLANMPKTVAQTTHKEFSIFVDGACGMCQERIETNALKVKGVEMAHWDKTTKQLSLEVDNLKFSEEKLEDKLVSVGHDTEHLKASDKAYQKLPGCCKYRKEEQNAHEEHDENCTHEETEQHEKLLEKVDHDGHNHSEHNNHSHESEIKHTYNKEANNLIYGNITELASNGKKEMVVGASVYWAETTQGTSSNINGNFELERNSKTNKLVISSVGYANDTIAINKFNTVNITLQKGINLDEIDVTYKKKTTEVSFMNTIKVQTINQDELKKAACCNLSESFDTNPTIDVSLTDAVTGTKQIQMLGLAGPYMQITRENMPYIRGLSALYGLNFTPGSWIQNMQLNTGAGSVVNGFEGITGQINIELKKPQNSEKLFLNLYTNEAGRVEANLNTRIKFNEKLSTGFLFHASALKTEWDKNEDNFIDHPVGEQYIAMNRWELQTDGWHTQFGFKTTYLDNKSGQLSSLNSANRWTADMNTKKNEAWLKIGKVFDSEQFTSFGFQNSFSYQNQESNFGSRIYDATHQSFYSNLIFERELKLKGNDIKLGISFQADVFDEQVENISYQRNESVPGSFFEYSYSKTEVFSVVAGIRTDYHSDYGLFFTPRLHVRYAPSEQTVFRFSAGKGQRTASIFSENIGIFASARNIIIHSENSENAYGLSPEIAYNMGLNYTQSAFISGKEIILSLDYYYTDFKNKIIIDYDYSAQEVHFYNQVGKSYANTFQAQVDAELVTNFDVRIAYRFNDVKNTYIEDERKDKALVSRHRAFINFAYETKNKFFFDLTMNYQAKKRIPNTATNPEIYQLEEFSPAFFMINGQISKHWKNFEIYTGVENLLNYTQENPILSVEDPNSQYFDSSLIWGPIFGRKVYGGIRISIK